MNDDLVEITDNEMLALLISDPDTAMTIAVQTAQAVVEELELSVTKSLDELNEEDKNLYVLLSTMIYMYTEYVVDSMEASKLPSGNDTWH